MNSTYKMEPFDMNIVCFDGLNQCQQHLSFSTTWWFMVVKLSQVVACFFFFFSLSRQVKYTIVMFFFSIPVLIFLISYFVIIHFIKFFLLSIQSFNYNFPHVFFFSHHSFNFLFRSYTFCRNFCCFIFYSLTLILLICFS